MFYFQYFIMSNIQIFTKKYKEIFEARKMVFGPALLEKDGQLNHIAMNNKTNKIPWYSVYRVTAAFVGAHKQKHAISEPGLRTCTVKLLRSSVMPLILPTWGRNEEWG